MILCILKARCHNGVESDIKQSSVQDMYDHSHFVPDMFYVNR
jgi:hypothetical protein